MTDHLSVPDFTDERLTAHAWAADLVGLPWPERLQRVRTDRTFATPSFIELCISLGRDFGLSPGDRHRWAQLAIEAAVRGGSRRAEELEPLAWAVLGTALRVRGRVSASLVAFMRCQELRHRTASALELADTLSLEASYWSTIAYWSLRGSGAGGLRRFGGAALARAIELVDEALRLSAPSASETTLASHEIQAGFFANAAERWSAADTWLLSALDRIDAAAHPRLALAAAHNLVKNAVDRRRLDPAMCALERLEGSYDRSGDPKILLLRDWLVADVTRARGHLQEAEGLLHAVRGGFAEQEMLYETADADVEMALLAVERGRWPTAQKRAARASRVLSATGAAYPARAAIRMFS